MKTPAFGSAPIAVAASPVANVAPPLLDDEVDRILYKGPSRKTRFQRKAPLVDLQREYKVTKSYREARTIVAQVSERHQQLQVAQEEAFNRELQAEKFTTQFVETRLATCGVPTVNDTGVILARQRKQKHKSNGVQSKSDRIQDAVRRAFGSLTLDLKELDLIHIPPQVYTTMLLQLGRMIRCINISRNSLREIPTEFCESFLQVDSVVYKENTLSHLPDAMIRLQHLQSLNAECNQLLQLPLHLPPSLRVVVLSRNRLHQFGNIHELTRVEELDLSYNHFQVLPCGLVHLMRLKKLVVSGNRLVTLALLPKRVQADKSVDQDDPESESGDGEADSDAARAKWRVEVGPATGETVYFHLQSHRVTRNKPKCFQIVIPPLALGQHGNNYGPQRPTVANQTKLYPDGWEIVISDATATQPTFVNHLTAETFVDIPPALDKLGDVTHLRSLVLSGNQLYDLPPSIGKLFRLKHLEAENNHIMALPDTLQDLKALEVIKLGMNALSSLPLTFMHLSSLVDLDLKLNRFQCLPETFGDLLHLQTLDLSSNSLENLPQSFLALRRLKTLKLQNNLQLVRSGRFKAETLATGDIAHVRWELQHQLQCEIRGGQPPVPQSKVVGAGDECWSTDIHLHKEFTQLIDVAQSTLVLDYHWKNLQIAHFPSSFFTSLGKLQELRLSGHDLPVIPSSFVYMTSLRVLQLRRNKIQRMEDDVFALPDGVLSVLEELDLEYNELTSLPESIGNLRSLRVLRASNNRLETIPDTISALSESLAEISLAHNHFVEPPSGFSSLQQLTRLDLAYNRLTRLDSVDFTLLQQLISLRCSMNQLSELPPSLAKTPLQELGIAGNRFTSLPSTILELKGSLTCLRIQSNKIFRLPVEFGELAKLELVECDGNPFRSPPPEVMALGIRLIRSYLLKRKERVDEITTLLATVGFTANTEVFQELRVTKLLTMAAPLPFLSQSHIEAFELDVDKYVNGAFYLRPPDIRGADLVNRHLLQQQFTRAQQYRAQVLHDLTRLCELIRSKKWIDKVDFRYDCERPWGRNGELVGVFMLNPIAVYEDQPLLPSIRSVVAKRVAHGFVDEAFEHDQTAVEDALTHYMGVYGPVGIAHDSVPFKCGCEDLLRFNKMHEPCFRSGWTVVQVVYTDEEAERRISDQQAIAEALQALRPQIETFLKTTEGETRFHKEVRVIKDQLRKDLKALKKRLKSARKRLKARLKAKAALAKQEAKEKAAAAKNKLDIDPVKLPAKLTLAEVKAKEEEAERTAALEERVTEMTKEYEDGKAKLGFGYHAFMEDVVAKLMESVGAQVKTHLIQQQREKAIAFGLRRPWDGDFEAYKALIRRKVRADGSLEAEDAASGALEDVADQEKDNSEISDVSFDGYADLVSGLTTANDGALDAEEDEEDEEDEEENPEERAAALAQIEVSDVSDDDDQKQDKASEDSEL